MEGRQGSGIPLKETAAGYWRALERSRVPASRACMVAAHAWDMEKAWSFRVGRPGRTAGSLDEIPGEVAGIERTQKISPR